MILRKIELHGTHFIAHFSFPRTLQIQGAARRLVFRCWKLTACETGSSELNWAAGNIWKQLCPDAPEALWHAEELLAFCRAPRLENHTFADVHDFLFNSFTAAIPVWRQMFPVTWLLLLSQCLIPVVMYACRTWSRTVRNGHRLGVLKNRVLRRILRRKREDAGGGRWKLRKEDRQKLRCSLDITNIMKSGLRWLEYIDCMGESRRV
jgi:hypothetical protein